MSVKLESSIKPDSFDKQGLQFDTEALSSLDKKELAMGAIVLIAATAIILSFRSPLITPLAGRCIRISSFTALGIVFAAEGAYLFKKEKEPRVQEPSLEEPPREESTSEEPSLEESSSAAASLGFLREVFLKKFFLEESSRESSLKEALSKESLKPFFENSFLEPLLNKPPLDVNQ